jgi:hypothetical protein
MYSLIRITFHSPLPSHQHHQPHQHHRRRRPHRPIPITPHYLQQLQHCAAN